MANRISTTIGSESLLTIPCHWNKEVISKIVKAEGKRGIKVGEVYGALADGGPVGHGRSRTSVVDVNKEAAIDFRQFLHENGLTLTYLLNAPFSFNGGNEQKRQLNSYLDWILGELKPDALTITSHELMQRVRQDDSEIPIHISTIAGVRNVADLEKFMDINPNRVVPHHDVGKDTEALKSIVDFGGKHGIQVELLATESCQLHCSMRKAHYEYLARDTKDFPFHMTCNAEKLTRPREFLLAGGVIRPEDMNFYEDMGVHYFKISGRSKPAEWLVDVANAYTDRGYDGNLIRLLGIDPSMKAEDWIHLSNKALDGFIGKFPMTGSYEDQIRYCDDWIIRLYGEGNFKIKDGSIYHQEGTTLVLDGIGGKKVYPIILRERGN